MLKILVTGAIAPLADLRPDLDPELADEVMDLLRADREMRASSLGALRTSLEAHRSPATLLEVPNDAPPSTRSTIAAPIRQQRRRPWLASGAIAAVAIGSAVGVATLRAPSAAPPSIPVQPTHITELPSVVPSTPATLVASAKTEEPAPPAPSASAPRANNAARLPPPREKPGASATGAAVAPGAPSRGPSGLVTDNPFHP